MLMPSDVGLNGLSADTPTRIVIDAGAIYANFVDADNPGILLGATRGGAVFTVEREIREIEVDGTIAPTKGLRRRSRVKATIEANLLEIFPNQIERMIAGADVDESDPDYAVITGGPVEDADYMTNIALVATIHDNDLPFVGLIENPLPESPFTLPTGPNSETVIKAVWTGHAALTDPYGEPWAIWIPKDITGS